jgi:hypothetical protein
VSDLELTLKRIGSDLEWPQTPGFRVDLAPRPARARRSRRGLRRPLAIALAALALTGASAVAAIPGARDAVLDFLGLRSVTVERVPRLPQPAPGADLGLGERTTLAAAGARVGFEPLIPRTLGDPESVWIGDQVPGGQLGLVYHGGKLLLTEFVGAINRPFMQKFIGAGTQVERVRVDGEHGLWIGRGPHEFAYDDADGQVRFETLRLAGPTLLLRRGRVLLRIEGARSKADAIRIARAAAP